MPNLHFLCCIKAKHLPAPASPASPADARLTVLQNYLHRHAQYTPEELARVLAAFAPRTLRKGEHLVQPGQVCRQFALVAIGCLRLYYLTDDGRENTHYFAFEGEGITALASFLADAPSPGYLQAVEQSTVWVCERAAYFALTDTIPGFALNHRKLVERAYTTVVRRMEHLLQQDAATRLAWLQTHHPAALQRLPNRVSASFLGIAPETLSRLRARSEPHAPANTGIS